MAPKRTRSARCTKAPEKILRFLDDAEEEAGMASSPEAQDDAEGGSTVCDPDPNVDEQVKEVHTNMEQAPTSLRGKTIAIVDVGYSCKDYLAEAGAAGGPHRIADEVWAIDEMAGLITHDRAFSMRPLGTREATWYWLRDHPGPLYCSDELAPYAGCLTFPLEEALNTVGVAYLTSSSAYAFAYAMMQGVARIKMYGVDALEVRPCIEFLVCKALSLGITIQIAADLH